ncbi:DNA-3-methyladenine glycosylase I [Roseomonas sp. CCTCC AB2023176]|uniref:DNA-3-methyladenine glycosylase I n=1 Tax=Roseomonas sp. CCTCC AB2023176 TaxID=3342640 RepID=UPI0035DF8840
MDDRARCAWCTNDRLAAYHDAEWGVPVRDDRTLFELLTLEGAQAGLSWDTVLRKRDGYRRAFAGFDPAAVAAFDAARIEALVADPGIIRHRGKIEATVTNARAFLAIQEEHGSFAHWLWATVDGRPVVTRRRRGEPVPATTPLSDRISKDLSRCGFRFVGSTITYAFLQASGVVDDHTAECWRAGSG